MGLRKSQINYKTTSFLLHGSSNESRLILKAYRDKNSSCILYEGTGLFDYDGDSWWKSRTDILDPPKVYL